MLDDGRLQCPYCGEWLDLGCPGVEIYRCKDGSEEAAFVPCCADLQWDLQVMGFEGVFGVDFAGIVRHETGLAPLKIDDWDGLLIYRLRGHAPGVGVKGWQRLVFDFIDEHHRHHKPPQGWKFGIAVYNGRILVGVAVVGRPVSRMIQKAEPTTFEVTRCCTARDLRLRRHAASKLYGMAAREAKKKLGARKLITYILESEKGISLKAAGWIPVAKTRGGSWNKPSRPRKDKAPTCRKIRWEKEV